MRILVIRLSSIGDLVHTLPAVAYLRRSLPTAHISWVVGTTGAILLKGSPAIDRIIEWEGVSKQFRRAIRLSGSCADDTHPSNDPAGRNTHGGRLNEGPRPGFDVTVDFQGLTKSALLALWSRAPRRIGFETCDLREKASRIFLTEQTTTHPFIHVIDKNLALARAVAGGSQAHSTETVPSPGPAEYEFPISIEPEVDARTDELLATGARAAIVNPGGGWPTKRWPPEQFGAIADWLWDQYGMNSFVTFGPGEEALADSVVKSARSGRARILASSLKEFVALARRGSLFVGGDTGPLHLAAASGTPIVGLYGPTAPERNGPFNPDDITVGRDLWCRGGCHRRKCWHWECLDLPLVHVKQAIARRLELSSGAGQALRVSPLAV